MAAKTFQDLTAKQKKEALEREAQQRAAEQAAAAARAEAARQAQYQRDVAAAMRAQAAAAQAAALPSTYADGSRAVQQGNQIVIVDRNGNVVQGATAGVNGQGRYYNSPVTSVDDLPAGSVDPAITYQMDAANRGVGYQEQDYQRDWAGFIQDALGQVTRPGDLDAVNPDGTYKYGRGLRDYFLSQDRLNHDYDQQSGDTHLGYQRLGNNQLQAINQAGALGGGALAQALAKRTAHETEDQSRISYARTGSLADLLTQATRGAGDAYTGLTRGYGENAAYQGTLTAQAAQSAAPMLADDPSYEVINGSLYQRRPDGGVQPVAKTTTPPVVKPKAKVPKPPTSFYHSYGGPDAAWIKTHNKDGSLRY